MIKPQSLRQHLLAAIPALDHDPERLLIFVEGGTLASTYQPGLSFEYRYTLEVIITDFRSAPEAVMVPLMQWLTRHQPELLAAPGKRDQVGFEVDVLAGDLVDLSIKLPLTERVVVTRDANDLLQLRHVGEPATDDAHRDTLRGGELHNGAALLAKLPAIAHE